MFRRLCALALLVSSSLAFGANKEIQELQREIAQLQDALQNAIGQLRRAQDQNFAALTALVQQAVSGSNEANKAVALLQSSISQSLSSMEGRANSRMDAMSNDLHAVQNSVSDLASAMARVQTSLQDVNNQLKVLQTPAAAPPPTASPAQPGASAAQPDLPPVSAASLYADAEKDYRADRLDMALDGFKRFLNYYPDSGQAADAQFYVGSIHYRQNNFQDAAKNFDLLLQRYPNDSRRAPDAHYFKGMSLFNIRGRETEARQELQELVALYPNSDYSIKVCADVQKFGIRCAAAPSKPAPKAGSKAGKKK